MHIRLFLAILLIFTAFIGADKIRLIQETDMGGDSDDQASFVRLLMYSNEFEIVGIILDRSDSAFQSDGAADNPTGASNALEMCHDYIDAYGQVRNNLIKHKSDYPTVAYLKSVTVHAPDTSNAGRDLIISEVDKSDPRPVWYGNWGSNSGTMSNLKRALDYVQSTRSQAEYEAFAAKIRIASLDGNNNSKRAYTYHRDVLPFHIETGYPYMDGGRWYHRFSSLVGADSADVTSNHGPLGAIWTGSKEGDTWCFLYLIPVGLQDPEQPLMGGWAGRYSHHEDYPAGAYWCDQQDYYNGSTNRDNTVKRWNTAARRDFKARMDWCVASSFSAANHEPVAVVQGDTTQDILYLNAVPGQTVNLSAAGSSDPDGDALTYTWTQYKEADSYSGSVTINNNNAQDCSVEIPSNAADKTIHIILDVTDDGTPQMTRFRRVVISVSGTGNVPPSVSAGADQSITLPDNDVNLNGTVTDPDDSPITNWSKQSGPGTVAFGNTSAIDTYAQFSAAGTYVLRLTADDGTNPVVSDTVSITVEPEPLFAPTNLSAAVISSSQIDLSWTDNSSNEDGFRIERATGSVAMTVSLSTYNGTNTSPTIELAGTVNSFKAGALQTNDRSDTWTSVPASLDGATRLLTARDDKGDAGYNSMYVINLSHAMTVYATISPEYGNTAMEFMDASWSDTGMTATIFNGKVFNIWSKDASAGDLTLGTDSSTSNQGATYIFPAAGGSGTSWSLIGTVSAGTTSYSDTGLDADTMYTYRVAANKGSDVSNWSNEDSATTLSGGVTNLPPTAAAAASPNSGTVPLAVSFTGSGSSDSDGSIVSYSWNFGDGGSASSANPSHTYTGIGSYTAVLTVTDDDGATDTDSLVITVSEVPNTAPVAENQSITTAQDTNVNIVLSGSDIDGDSLTYAIEANPSNGALSGSAPNVTYTPDAGWFGSDSFTFTVNDGTVDSNTATISITVTAASSDLVISNISRSGYTMALLTEGDQYYIDRSYTIAALPVELEGLTWIMTANNDKNNSASDYLTFEVNQDVTVYIGYDKRASSLPTFMASYSNTGLGISVTDGSASPMTVYSKSYTAGMITLGGNLEGGTTGAGSNYTVLIKGSGGGVIPPEPNQTPVAVVSADTVSGYAPLTVSFTGAGSYDSDGSVIDYAWDFMDGGTSVSANPSHTFNAVGEYQVDLTVTDDEGDTGSASILISVTQEPTGSLEVLVASPVSYQLSDLLLGSLPYVDRSYSFTDVPVELEGEFLIRTANNDKNVSAASHLVFTVSQPVDVFVCYDSRASSLPIWMSGYYDTGMTVRSTDVLMNIFKQSYAAGTISLGGNIEGGSTGAGSNYYVVVTEQGASGKGLTKAPGSSKIKIIEDTWYNPGDSDGDGLTDIFELTKSLVIYNTDTDWDGIADEHMLNSDGQTLFDEQAGQSESGSVSDGTAGGGCTPGTDSAAWLLIVVGVLCAGFRLQRQKY